MALLFARSVSEVTVWGRDPARVAETARSRVNSRHLPGIVLPRTITVSADAGACALGSDLIVAAVPSAYLRATLSALAPVLPAGVPVLSVVKGIENGTFARPGQIILETLGPRPVAALSGPSHAEELARGLPASVVVAGDDAALNGQVQDVLNLGVFRVYTNSDLIGVELAGALKNVLGIASGICDGLGFGDNAKAALLTRGLVEIQRFATDLGGHPSTFAGLAGIGDMITTCYSPFGRNRSVGMKIGQGVPLADVLAGMADVAEGVPTTRSVHDQAAARGIEMPITRETYQVLFEGKSAREAVSALMLRAPKEEWT